MLFDGVEAKLPCQGESEGQERLQNNTDGTLRDDDGN